MLLDVVGLIIVVEFLTKCLSELCNVPFLAMGIKHFCRRCFAKHDFAGVKANLEKALLERQVPHFRWKEFKTD
jgi:hypothetical protein